MILNFLWTYMYMYVLTQQWQHARYRCVYVLNLIPKLTLSAENCFPCPIFQILYHSRCMYVRDARYISVLPSPNVLFNKVAVNKLFHFLMHFWAPYVTCWINLSIHGTYSSLINISAKKPVISVKATPIWNGK